MMEPLRSTAKAAFWGVGTAVLALAIRPSVVLGRAQLEMSGTFSTNNYIITDFTLANGGGFPSEARFATYSHSSGTSESRGLTYSVGGIDSVIDLYSGFGVTPIAQSDDLNTPPGNLDSEIGTPGVTHRTGYTPISSLADGDYEITLRPFNLSSLGNGSFSMESRWFAPTVTIRAPQVQAGGNINNLFFDGFNEGPQTMTIGPSDNLVVNGNMFTSTSGEIAMTGGSLTVNSVYHMSDRVGTSTVRQSGGTSIYGAFLNMAPTASATARYELSGNAILNATTINVAAVASFSTARFIQSGTSTANATSVVLGNSGTSGEAAEYNLNGGVLNVLGNMTVTAGNIFELAGGELRVNSLSNVLLTSLADFHWSHGTIMLQNDAPTEDTFGLFGPTLTLTPGRVLRTTFAENFNSAIVVDGGKLSVPNLAAGHPVQLKSGELNMTGAGGLTIGTAGPLGNTPALGTGMTVSVTNATTINAGASLVLDGGTLASGSLANNGLIRGDGFVTANMTNAATGEIRALAGKTLSIGGINGANAGLINLQGGTAEFSQALTNGTNGQILGRGMLAVGGAGLTNNGHIALSSGFSDVFGNVTNNTGSAAKGINVSGNADVTFWDDVNNVGVSRFNVSAGSSATFFGTYTGAGITGGGSKYFEADLSPGASPAAVTFEGNVSLGANAKLIVDVGGLVQGDDYDHLNITGNLSLDGTLAVSLFDDFTPSAGDSFNILDWGSPSGTFDALDLPSLGSSLQWDVSELYTTGELSVSPVLLGDYNQDGTVNAADYTVYRNRKAAIGGTTLPNDAGAPGVTIDDYNYWKAHYGETLGSGTATNRPNGENVPEPSSMFLLVIGSMWMLALRRKELEV